MKVALTNEARDDLKEIAEFIALDAPRRALSFVRELRESALAISRAPYAHPIDPRYDELAVRRRVHGAYLILYRISKDRVDIIRIVHGARDVVRMPNSGGQPPPNPHPSSMPR